MLSAAVSTTAGLVATPKFIINPNVKPQASPGSQGYTPQQIDTAYTVDQINFNGTPGTGAGQTIAIVDAFNDPNIASDVSTFSTEFNLPQFNAGGSGPTFQVLNQNGQSGSQTLPPNAPVNDAWDIEESLDVEWVHSVAPQASIILYEANSDDGLTNGVSDLYIAEATAAANPAVSVISNSWGGAEYATEDQDNIYFTTPSGHQGITFLAATGDQGSPTGFPDASPDVVAVSGTNLQLQSDNSWASESVWNEFAVDAGATSGGPSLYEPLPSYQSLINGSNGASKTLRNTADVSADADPLTGVWVYDSFYAGETGLPAWQVIGGTSLACPLWAGMIGIANQGRALAGKTTLNGQTQTLPTLYNLPSSDFHDVVVGNNGTYSAGIGYDLPTGIGTPIADLIIPGLVAGSSSPQSPIVSAPSTAITLEDNGITFSISNGNSLGVSDSAANGNPDSLALSVSHGTLTLESVSGLSFTSGANDSPSFTVSGTVAQLNAALGAGLFYLPTTSYVGSDKLTATLTDTTDGLSDQATTNIVITAFGPPTFTGSTSASVSEDASLVFSTANGNLIQVIDAAAGLTGIDTTTFTVSSGTVTLGSTHGITVTSGLNGSSSFTVNSDVGDLDAALNGLTYMPTPAFYGADILTISVFDPTSNLTNSFSVNLTIPALPPALVAPTSVVVLENQSFEFSQTSNPISISDVNPGGDSLALSVADGTLSLNSLSGLTLTGTNGTSSFVVSGPLNDLVSALNGGLIYTPNHNFQGADSLSMTATNLVDNATHSTSVRLLINPVPTVVGPTTATVTENTPFAFSSSSGNEITVTDPASGANLDTLTISVANGTVTMGSTTGLAFSNGTNGSGSFTVTGTIGNLSAGLNGLIYQPDFTYTGSDQLALSLVDPSDNLSGSSNINLTINALSAPALSGPSTATVVENSTVVFSNSTAITLADNGAGINSDTETLSVTHGTLTFGSTSGLIFLSGSNGTGSFTVKGTVANFNADLNGLIYTPTTGYAGSDSMLISVVDSADGKSGSASVAITVTALPPAINAPGSASMNENGTLPFAPGNGNGIVVSDANPGSDTLALSVSHGKITLATMAGLTISSGSNGSAAITVSGTISSLNAALNGVTYQPTIGYTGSDSLGMLLQDPGNGGSASTAVSLSIIGLAPPSITAPSTATTTQNVAIVFSPTNGNTILVGDTGAGATPDSLTLSVGHGTLTLSTTSGLTFSSGSNGSAAFTVTGTLANMNAALSGLKYQPTSSYSGSDSLAISISNPMDSHSASTSVALTVNAFSPPSVTAPTGAVVSENSTLVFSSTNNNPISVADAGPGSSSDLLTFSVTHGTITLATTSGLTFTSGSNGTASFTVTGSIANLNAAVSSVSYKPTSGYTGSDQIAIALKDNGDGLTASASVAITVSGATSPAITAPSSVTTKTNSIAFTNPGAAAISITDPNAGGNLQELLIRAPSGTLTLATTSGITFVSGANNSTQMVIEGTLASLNAAINGLTYALGTAKSATLVLQYTDLGTGLQASASITVSQSSGTKLGPNMVGAAPVGGVTPSTASVSPSTTPISPDTETTQWQGVTAAVAVLGG